MATKTTDPIISYRSAVGVIWQTFLLAWRLEKAQVIIYAIGASLEITGTIVSTYAGARLISLLFTALTNEQERGDVWSWLAVTIISQLAVNIGFWLMGYSRRILYILASKWSSLNFMRQLCVIDIQMFHDTESRNMINKLDNGHGWQIPNALQNTFGLLYGCIRAIAIIVVVATIAWWSCPLPARLPDSLADCPKPDGQGRLVCLG